MKAALHQSSLHPIIPESSAHIVKFSKQLVLASMMGLVVNLSGCIPLMVADLAAQGVVKATTDMQPHPPKHKYLPAVLDQAEVLPYTAKGSLDNAHPGCTYEGIVTPYEQTWDEINPENHTSDRRASLGEIAGFVAIVLKMNCPGQAAQPVFRAGYQPGLTLIRFGSHKGQYELWGFNMDGKWISEDGKVEYETGHSFGSNARMEALFNYQYATSTHDMLHPDSDGVPKWLPQVMTKLVRLSRTNPEIKVDLKLATPLIQKALPGLAPQLAALR